MPRLPPELAAARRPDAEDLITHLGQSANIAEIDALGCGEWTILYESQRDAKGSRCCYSGLLSPAQVPGALGHTSWDLSIGRGTPSFTQRDHNGVEIGGQLKTPTCEEIKELVNYTPLGILTDEASN